MAFLLASQAVAFHGVSLASPSACLFQQALVVAVSEGQGNGGSIGEQQLLHPEGVCSNLSLHQTHDSIPSSYNFTQKSFILIRNPPFFSC